MRIDVILLVVVILGVFALELLSRPPQTDLPASVRAIHNYSDELVAREPSLAAMEKVLVPTSSSTLYTVIQVIDGDTIDVLIDAKVERLRLIGINTPETVDPRKPVECFGVQASERAKEILVRTRVRLEHDDSQGDRDKYQRLLRYVFLEDGTNFNLQMIAEGYAYEYTYDVPYKYHIKFKEAERYAREANIGLWGALCKTSETDQVVVTPPSQPVDPRCSIKGNINTGGEKIYHVSGCDSYDNTKIDLVRGEQWFCSESEAERAGWRKAKNCI